MGYAVKVHGDVFCGHLPEDGRRQEEGSLDGSELFSTTATIALLLRHQTERSKLNLQDLTTEDYPKPKNANNTTNCFLPNKNAKIRNENCGRLTQ